MGYDVIQGVDPISYYFGESVRHAPYTYKTLFSGTERHGVWEWRAMHQGLALRRYVVLSVANLEHEDRNRDAQFHVGIDDDRSFTKRLIVRSSLRPEELPEFVRTYAAIAIEAAETLAEDDLDMLYAQRRVFPPDQVSVRA
jgi:GrpB-like predicted nucleotidyltransferase (UPF0157 family)